MSWMVIFLDSVNLDDHAIDVEFNDCVYVFACVDEWWHDNHVVDCWYEMYMLNVE